MQLPQHIIDLVGDLFDEGLDDETICRAVLKEWRKRMESPRRSAFGNGDPAGASIDIQACDEVCSPVLLHNDLMAIT